MKFHPISSIPQVFRQNLHQGIQHPTPVPAKRSEDGSSFHSTFDIIDALEKDQFPNKVMINIHPERWNDNLFWLMEELVSQNIKNVIKKHFFVKK